MEHQITKRRGYKACRPVWMFNEQMNTSDWIVFGIFAAAGVSVALMTAAAIVFLRALNLEFASTSLHSYVRRYGLWKICLHILRTVRNGQLRLHWSRYKRFFKDARWGYAVALCGAIAGMLLPVIVLLPLFLESSPPSLLDNALELTAGIAAILFASFGIGLWLRGLSYMARPEVDRVGALPHISSKDLSLDVRNNLALNIFWYSRLWWVGIAGAAYPWLFAVVMSEMIKSSSLTTGTVTVQSNYALIGFIALSVTVIFPFVTLHFIRRQMVWWKACRELYLLIQPSDDDRNKNQSYLTYFRAADPLIKQRSRLARLALDLSNYARVFDGRRIKNPGPHPISTILRAVSRCIYQFLANQDSLRESIPADLLDTLTMTLVMLCQSKPSEVYQNLAKQVAAFDQNGNPADDLNKEGKSKIVAFASRTTAGLRGAASLIVALGTSILIMILCILYIRHRIDTNGLLRYLP